MLLLSVLSTAVLGLCVAGSPIERATTSGVNDYNCKAAPGKEPIVFLHGLPANPTLSFLTKAAVFTSKGYCVFAPQYGTTAGIIYAGAKVEDSSREVAGIVDKVLASTGAKKINLVGHSMGTLVGAYYLKFDGGGEKVKTFVGLGPVYGGTSMAAMSLLKQWVPGLTEDLCPGCIQVVPPSPLLDKLHEGGITVPGPTYTNIMSKLDNHIVPYTSGRIDEEGVRNIVIQDECPSDIAGHLAMLVDPNISKMIQWAIDGRQGDPLPRCMPFLIAI